MSARMSTFMLFNTLYARTSVSDDVTRGVSRNKREEWCLYG